MNSNRQDILDDAFGYRVRQTLNRGTQELAPRTLQRLSAARALALGRHRESDDPLPVRALVATTGHRAQPSSFGARLAFAFSAIVVSTGIFLISDWNRTRSIAEIADIDSMILSDDLPIDANADPGFLHFLKRPDAFTPSENPSASDSDDGSAQE